MHFRHDNHLQYKWKVWRCHAITVSGLTIIRASRQPTQIFESQTQKMRSVGRSLGRGWRSLKMASCCLRARFSRARSRCRLKVEKNAEMQAIKPLITSPTILGASREIRCFLQIRTFGDGQAFFPHAHGARPTRRISESNRASNRKTSNLGSVFSVGRAELRSSKHFSIHIKAASISPKPAEIAACANGGT